jgi:hypothetical protein
VLAERQRARSADHAGLEVEEHRAGDVLAARGYVVKTLIWVLIPIEKQVLVSG